MKKTLLALLPISGILFMAATAHADTIVMKDGKEVRGIVVEDYQNRIVFSTPDGEMTIMKDDIRELGFDSEEDNLIKLAEQARERKDYKRAYYYYDTALKANPDSKAARDGLALSHGYLFRKEEARKEDDIRRREMFEQYGAVGLAEKSPEEELAEASDKLVSVIGVKLSIENGLPRVALVSPGSPAYRAGIRMGDGLVSVWSRMTGYLTLKEVIDILLDRPAGEIKCVIERSVDIPLNQGRNILTNMKGLIGASFSMEFDGLTIAEVVGDGVAECAGIKKGDLVTGIDGESTRYMPLRKANKKVRESNKETVNITVRRQIVIWRIEQT